MAAEQRSGTAVPATSFSGKNRHPAERTARRRHKTGQCQDRHQDKPEAGHREFHPLAVRNQNSPGQGTCGHENQWKQQDDEDGSKPESCNRTGGGHFVHGDIRNPGWGGSFRADLVLVVYQDDAAIARFSIIRAGVFMKFSIKGSRSIARFLGKPPWHVCRHDHPHPRPFCNCSS